MLFDRLALPSQFLRLRDCDLRGVLDCDGFDFGDGEDEEEPKEEGRDAKAARNRRHQHQPVE